MTYNQYLKMSDSRCAGAQQQASPTPETQQRRQISCLKAIWALASIPSAPALVPGHLPSSIQHLPHLFFQADVGAAVASYELSASYLVHWSAVNWMREYLNDCAHHLSEMANTASYRFRPIHQYLSTTIALVILARFDTGPSGEIQKLAEAATSPAEFNRVTEVLCSRLSHGMLFSYLRHIVIQAVLPYRWEDTFRMLMPADFGRFLPAGEVQEVEETLAIAISAPSRLDNSDAAASIAPVIQELVCYLWRPTGPRPIPPGIIAHLNSLKALWIADQLFSRMSSYMWPSFSSTLRAAKATSDPRNNYPGTMDDILETLWLTARCATQGSRDTSEDLLEDILASGSPLVPSVVAAVQTAVLDDIHLSNEPVQLREGSYSFSLLKRHLPADVFPANPLDSFVISYRDYFAARLCILADFLGELAAGSVPHRAQDTIAWIGDLQPHEPIYDRHQLHFARSLRRFCQPPSLDDLLRRELLSSVVNADIFGPYSAGELSDGSVPWLQNAAAVEEVRLALVEYRGGLSPSPELTRVKSIIHDLEAQSSRAQPSLSLLPIQLSSNES
ncbi:hypothetical protein C8F01DRAFT_1312136 [Mycena amicta]|nr:hypothetical protein C8F01DRAFT_1312136 [Mycena amicta]